MPVREQHVVEESTQTLDKIKELMRSYAMTRPQLKLIFKVLKTSRLNSSFASPRNPCVRKADPQIFGTEAAAKCFEKMIFGSSVQEVDGLPGQHERSNEGQYGFEAFIVKPDTASYHLPKFRFYSIDGRPMSGSRCTMKKLTSIYLKYVHRALGPCAQDLSISDVFIQLNIKCPPGSYDVNVEPCKNDVLLADETTVLTHFEGLCKEVYEPLRNSKQHSSDQFVLGLAGSPETDHVDEPVLPSVMQPEREFVFGVQLIGDMSADMNGLTEEDTRRNRPLSLSRRLVGQVDEPVPPSMRQTEGEFVIRPQLTSDMSANMNEFTGETSGRRSRSAGLTWRRNAQVDEPMGFSLTPPDQEPILRHPGEKPRDLYVTHVEPIEFCLTPPNQEPILRHPEAPPRDLHVPPSHRYGVSHSPVSSPVNSSPHELPRRSTRQTNNSSLRRVQPPWTPPSIQRDQNEWNNMYDRGHRVRSDGLKQATISFQGSKQRKKRQTPDCASIHTTNIRTDDQVTVDREPVKTSLPQGDPRAYLLLRQKSMADEESSGRPKKFRRLKSSLMPLENTPADEQIHQLILPRNVNMQDLPKLVQSIEKYDKYIAEGEIEDGLDIDLGEGSRIEDQLNGLLSRWGEQLTGEQTEVKCGLTALLRGKGTEATI